MLLHLYCYKYNYSNKPAIDNTYPGGSSQYFSQH